MQNDELVPSMSDAEIEELIISLEREALSHWANGSVEGYTVHFAEDVIYSDDIMAHTGVFGRENARAYGRKLDSMQVVTKHTYDMVNPQVRILDNAAVLHLINHPYKPDGTDGTKWRASIVYRKKTDGWEVVNADN